jgi:tetratricopeptide (TPR) repeat protein
LNESHEYKKTGNELFKEDKYEEALEMYTKALRTCPFSFSKERSIFYSNRSVCFLKMKDLDKCIKECSQSINLDPTFVKPLLRRAECHETNDKLDEAVEDYKKLIDLEPRVMSHKQKCYVSVCFKLN